MKNKYYLLGVLVMVGLSLTTYAQKNVKITWGPDFELPKKHYELGFIGDSKSGYIDISHQRAKSIILQKFSPSLKLTGQNEIPVNNLPKGYMIEALWNMNYKNYLFYSTWSKADKTERLYAQEINVDKGNFEGSPKELLNSTEKLSGTLVMTGRVSFGGWGGSYNTADKWSFYRSADSSKLLIEYRLKPKEKKDAINKDLIGLFVYDKSLNQIWGEQVEMPYTEKMMDNEDYQVDKNGNVYILAKVYGSDAKKRDKNDYHYEVLMYSKGSKKPNISSFKFADKTVVDIALNEDKNGRMICSGFYSKNNKGTDGAFFLAFDEESKTMKNIKKGFYEFPTDVIKQFESAKSKKKMEKKESKGEDQEVSNLEFRNQRIDDDGSITLFGEQYVLIIYYTYDSKGHVTEHRKYYYDDIYVTKIGPDGELKWVKKIPKAQVGSSPYGMGYHLQYDGQNSYLFFVDNIKNLNLKPDEAPAVHMNGMGGVLMCVKLDADGKTSKSSIFDFREEKMNVIVKDFSNVTNKITIGRARKLKRGLQFNFSEGKILQLSVE